jgi:capsular polysaccharide export protein
VPHRQRQLSLEQLVAGTLILYPSYFDPVTRLPCGPEVVIERMSRPEVWRPGLLVTLRRLQGEAMRLVQKWRPSIASNSR